MDKSFWSEIQENDFALPEGYELDSLTSDLLEMLASSDPDLRLGIAYNTFQNWIVEQNLYNDEKLSSMLDQLLAYLQIGIGESGTDTACLRSVSLWIIAFILQRDANEPFISRKKFSQIFDQIATYMRDEQDFRGYVEGKGWIHTVAHEASLLAAIVENPEATQETHETVLDLIAKQLIRKTEYVYQAAEDERMARTVYLIIEARLVDIDYLRQWLKQLESVMDLASAGMVFDIQIFNSYINTRNFVRTLYFPIHLCIPEKPPVWSDLLPDLENAIKAIGLC